MQETSFWRYFEIDKTFLFHVNKVNYGLEKLEK